MLKRISDGWSFVHLTLTPEDAEALYWFLLLSAYPSNGPRFQAVQKAKSRVIRILEAQLEG